MQYPVQTLDIVNVRITFKKARVPLLEAVAFKDNGKALEEILALGDVKECVILQTCNRVELYVVCEDGESVAKKAGEYLAGRAGALREEAFKAVEFSLNRDALMHLLRVASGLESMVVGENEILGQVLNAYLEAESLKAVGPILRTVFRKAVSVGKRVRNETGISKGAVSVGSISVKFAESLLGGIDGRNVLVIGAGEMGTCVAKALARYKPNAIFIANRTYERALKLAEEVSGKALKFDKLEEALEYADIVICATSAPHYVLTEETVCKIMKQRKNPGKLIIIDISNPRNVEKTVKNLEGIALYDIDDFQVIIERNLEEKQKSAEKALKILDEELPTLCKELKAQSVRDLISQLFLRVEEMRKEELLKALNMLGEINEREKRVIDDLTRIIVKKMLMPVVENLRSAALNDEREILDGAVKLLGVKNFSIPEWSEADG
ncbi:MAG: glutamyl-tRNA reductase [Candidatus Bathyarchaeales archaeon]